MAEILPPNMPSEAKEAAMRILYLASLYGGYYEGFEGKEVVLKYIEATGVLWEDLGDDYGKYDPYTKEIKLGTRCLTDLNELMLTVLHEGVHAIDPVGTWPRLKIEPLDSKIWLAKYLDPAEPIARKLIDLIWLNSGLPWWLWW